MPHDQSDQATLNLNAQGGTSTHRPQKRRFYQSPIKRDDVDQEPGVPPINRGQAFMTGFAGGMAPSTYQRAKGAAEGSVRDQYTDREEVIKELIRAAEEEPIIQNSTSNVPTQQPMVDSSRRNDALDRYRNTPQKRSAIRRFDNRR